MKAIDELSRQLLGVCYDVETESLETAFLI